MRVCVCVCVSDTASSVSLQHVSDTWGVDWKREERGGSKCDVGVAMEQTWKGSRDQSRIPIIPWAIKSSELAQD